MKETRLYGLFEKVDGKWVRLCPSCAYKKSLAIRIFQNHLLAGSFEGKTRALRPVPCPTKEG